jgi:HlyD family secretion protein
MKSLLKKKWFWVLAVIVAFGGYKYYKSVTTPPNYQTATVERGTVTQTVSVSSTLVANTEIRLNFERSGRIKEIVTSVGKTVSAGDVLARLDVADLNAEVARTQAILDQAEAGAGLNDESLREARKSVSDAKDYSNAVRDAQDQAVDAADKAYDNAVDYENDVRNYYDQVVSDSGAGSKEVKSAKLTLTTATNARKSADEAKTTARRNRDVATQLAENSWNANKQKLKTLESSSQMQSVDSTVTAARASYERAMADLNKTTLKAPMNGTVTVLNYKKGEVIGTAAQDFGKLLSMDFLLEAKVPESDIAKVKLGQQAEVAFDAFPSNERLHAEVADIDPASTVIQDVVYYKIKLAVKEKDARLKAGMSADIDIRITQAENALWLPSRAIKKDGTQEYVEKLATDGKTLTRFSVTTGLRGDESKTEIKQGVNQGDTVVIGLAQ